ncbi:MAG: hypothetical protein Q4A36_04020 [Candidatus Saccharibacteria bacterium]|nr:hypothetical protein [Candidatus Saccharibacteria bacterium]
MDKTEQVHTNSENQEPTEAEKVLGSMPEFRQSQDQETTEEVAKEDSELLKDAKTSYDIYLAKTRKRIKEAIDRGYDINEYARDLADSNAHDFFYLIEFFDENGADMNRIRYRVSDQAKIDNLEIFKENDPDWDIDKLVANTDDRNIVDVIQNLDSFLKYGAHINIDDLTARMAPREIVENLDILEKHGANIDIQQLYSKLNPREIAQGLDALSGRGVDIDVDNLVSKLDPFETAENLDVLERHGANIDIDKLVSNLDLNMKAKFVDILNKYGANIDLASLIGNAEDFDEATKNDEVDFKFLKDHGVALEKIIPDLNPADIPFGELDYLISLGIDVDANSLVAAPSRDPRLVYMYIDTLLANGVDVDVLISKFSDKKGLMSYENKSLLELALMRNGLDPDDIESAGGLYGPYQYRPSSE